jgi:hypothetical protein
VKQAVALLCALSLAGTAAAQGAASKPAAGDSLIPPGYGTLRQDQIAIRVQINGLTVSAIPLEEGVIRTLAPDSYRTLHAIRESKKAALEALRSRNGLTGVQAWYVWFFNAQQGDARFDAFDFLVRSVGQDFRPLDALPLTPGFSDGRVAQRATQGAVYAFDPQINLNQPLTVTALGQQSTTWTDSILQLIERERSLVWSRAASAKP